MILADIKQITGGNVTPIDDAVLYDFLVGDNGIFSGAVVTVSGNNTLNITAGRGIICGRTFEIMAGSEVAALMDSAVGAIYVKIDLSAQEPITVLTVADETLPEWVQEDLSAGGQIYEMPLYTYQVSSTSVSNLVRVVKDLEGGGGGGETLPQTASVAISSSNWTGSSGNYQASKRVANILASSIVMVTPAASATDIANVGKWGIYCSSQNTDTLVFKSTSTTKPNATVNMNVVFWGGAEV